MLPINSLIRCIAGKHKSLNSYIYNTKYYESYWCKLKKNTQYTDTNAILGQKKLYIEINPIEALQCFTKCDMKQHSNTILSQQIARCYREIGNIDQSIKYYEMYLECHPNDYENLYHLSCLYDETNGLEQGEDLWTKALNDNANNDEAKMYYALWLMEQCKSYHSAFNILHPIINNLCVEPKSRPYWMMGSIYNKLGFSKLADDFYNIALNEYGDDNAQTLAAKAMDCWMNEDWQNAIKLKQQYIECYDVENSTNYVYNKCIQYMYIAKLYGIKMKNLDKMLEYIQHGIVYCPHYDFSEFFDEFKQCFNENDGEYWKKRMNEIGNHCFVSNLFYGVYLFESDGYNRQSISWLNDAVKCNDKSCIALNYYANAIAMYGDSQDIHTIAIKQWIKAIELSPTYIDAYIHLIEYYCGLGSNTNGYRQIIINYCDKALEYDKNNSVLYGFKAIHTYFIEMENIGDELAKIYFVKDMRKYIDMTQNEDDAGKKWMNGSIETFLRFGLGIYYMNIDKIKQALDYLIPILEENEFILVSEEILFINIIDCYQRLNQQNKLKLYNILGIAKFPENARINSQYGLYLVNFEKKYEVGLKHLNRAISLAKKEESEQELIAICLMTARVYVYMKEFSNAIECYQEILDIRRDGEDSYYQTASEEMKECLYRKALQKKAAF